MSNFSSSLTQYLKRLINRLRRGPLYRPIPAPLWSAEELVQQAASYFRIPVSTCQQHFETYQAFSQQKGYAQRLGENRTLNFEEAFLLYLSALRLRPAQAVEIGVQYGKSTRRILDILRLIRPDSQLTAFDIVDQIRFVSHDEVNLVLHDLTEDFETAVLRDLAPGLIFVDTRPYDLLKNVITSFLSWSLDHPGILAIHDCTIRLYNPHMRIPRSAPHLVSSRTGTWERYILSEVFDLPPRQLDDVRTSTHHLRIFGTRHGIALLAPLYVLDSVDSA